jgi:ADP-ribosylglycohydrolase
MAASTITLTPTSTTLSMDTLLPRCHGLLMGCATGDALGIPYENMTKQQISDLITKRSSAPPINGVNTTTSTTSDHKSSTLSAGSASTSSTTVSSSLSSSPYVAMSGLNPFVPADFEAGRYTDDTQLFLAVIRTIIKRFVKENQPSSSSSSSSTATAATMLSKDVEDTTSSRTITTRWPLLMGHNGLQIMSDEHVMELKTSIIGWGGARIAVQRLLEHGHDYYDRSGNHATGNGVLMKLGAISFFHAVTAIPSLLPVMSTPSSSSLSTSTTTEEPISNENQWWTPELANEIGVIARMTHTHPVAIVTAQVLVRWGIHIFMTSITESSATSSSIMFRSNVSRYHLLELAYKWAIEAEALNGLDRWCASTEPAYDASTPPIVTLPSPPPPSAVSSSNPLNINTAAPLSRSQYLLSSRLKRMTAEWRHDNDISLTDQQILDISNGATFFCVNSLTCVIGIWCGAIPSYENTVMRAATIGGDTDSNAAIVGSLLGGVYGIRSIPEPYGRFIYQRSMILDTASQLAVTLHSLIAR